MVALAVSSFLMLGVFEIFIGSSSNDRIAKSFARIQENGRIALELMGRNIRMAGSQGLNAGTQPLSDGINGFEIGHQSWSTRPTELNTISGVLNGTDVIYIKFIDASGSANNLAYYVKDTGRNNDNGKDVYALYQFDQTTGSEQELVEGIEQLQITYGQLLKTGNIRFVPVDDANMDFEYSENEKGVVAVRFSILVAGNSPVLQANDNSTYALAGTYVAPAGTGGAEATHPVDRYLRRVFSSTVYLRNYE
ncbi:hypothetical protein BGP75_12015 [Motiliproteus sp. MSK22-1]|nr:hypothetical protein BGP75_12015 [Motiliproteus sp. MSK22-1]